MGGICKPWLPMALPWVKKENVKKYRVKNPPTGVAPPIQDNQTVQVQYCKKSEQFILKQVDSTNQIEDSITIDQLQKELSQEQWGIFEKISEEIKLLLQQHNNVLFLNQEILSILKNAEFDFEDSLYMIQQNTARKSNQENQRKQISVNYSKEQIELVDRFRKKVDSLNLPKYYDDEYLIRFLKSRDWDFDDTWEMFENFIKWRNENKVDQIRKIEFTEIVEMRKIFPHGYHHVDLKGRPVLIEILTGLKYEDMLKQSEDSEQGIMSRQRISNYFIKEFELLINEIFPFCSQQQGKTVNQMVRIIDLKKYVLKPDQIKDFLALTSKILQDNYPEILGTMYLINATSMFKMLWKGIKLILPSATQKKIVVLGKDFLKDLQDVISIVNIPEQLGGNCRCQNGCLSQNVGPWLQK